MFEIYSNNSIQKLNKYIYPVHKNSLEKNTLQYRFNKATTRKL